MNDTFDTHESVIQVQGAACYNSMVPPPVSTKEIPGQK